MNENCKIMKRDGKMQKFDIEKITAAIEKSSWTIEETINYDDLKEKVLEPIVEKIKINDIVSIDEIQNLVEFSLMKYNPIIAKHYIIYRNKRDNERRAKELKGKE